jgi:calcineurin-like phosphoesterase family protein
MAWFFTSDWHLGHSNIIKYCRRPFVTDTESELLAMADRGSIPASDIRISLESTKRMTDTIIDNTNAVVGEDDFLVHAGDFLFSNRDVLFDTLEAYRKRIVCKNIILIWGNHDDALRDLYFNTGRYKGNQWSRESTTARAMFHAAYDQFMFNVSGQKIFVNHYPARSWDCAHHGAWMLYGHVHNLFQHEDNGRLQPTDEKVLAEGFRQVIGNHYGHNDEGVIADLLKVVASLNGIDLTLDIGVDNTVRGPLVSWGTPWSMTELYDYMNPKKAKWEARQSLYRQESPRSTLKGDPTNAHPKF